MKLKHLRKQRQKFMNPANYGVHLSIMRYFGRIQWVRLDKPKIDLDFYDDAEWEKQGPIYSVQELVAKGLQLPTHFAGERNPHTHQNRPPLKPLIKTG